MPRALHRIILPTRLIITPIACLLFAGGALEPATSCAQESELAQIYSDGVHAFFRCDAHGARQFLDDAILHGSRDPRVYYFRALAQHAMGDTVAFEEDVRMAAELEVRGSGTFDIGRTLERIQGPTRIELERLRREVHLNLAKQRPVTPTPGTDEGAAQPNVVPDFGRQLPSSETDPFQDDESPDMEEVAPDEQEPAAESDEPEVGPEETQLEEPEGTDTEAPADEPEAEADDMDAFGTEEAEPAPDTSLEEPAEPAEEAPDAGLEAAPAEDEPNPFETGVAEEPAPADAAPADAPGAAEGAAGPAAGPPGEAGAEGANAADGAAEEATDDVFNEDNPFDGDGAGS